MFHGHGRGQDEVFQLRQKMFVTNLTRLGGAFKYFSMFTPITVNMIQFSEHIFQRGLKTRTLYRCIYSAILQPSIEPYWDVHGS